MGLQSQNNILAGTNLARAAIQSPNYVAGVSGWIIRQDGSAEFNSGTFRGPITAAGANGGVFVYDPTAGAGNLIASMTDANTDPFGDATKHGITSYSATAYSQLLGGNIFTAQLSASVAAAAEFSSPAAGEAELSSGITTTVGDVAARIDLISTKSASNPLGTATGGVIDFTNALLVAGAGGALPVATNAGLTGFVPITKSDTSTTTNANAVGVQPISAVWTIPANDAKVGTKYEIVLPWQATMEATNTLQLGSGLNGAVMTNAVTISAAIVGAGVGIRGTIRAWIKIKTGGAGGTADFFFDGTVQQTGASVTFANSGSIPTQPALAVAFNTTVANTLQINSQWGGSTAGQTVSGFDSDFVRSGP